MKSAFIAIMAEIMHFLVRKIKKKFWNNK